MKKVLVLMTADVRICDCVEENIKNIRKPRNIENIGNMAKPRNVKFIIGLPIYGYYILYFIT